MEGLLNKAEFILDKSHEILIKGGCGHILGQPLFHKLAEIYADEGSKAQKIRNTSISKVLLEKLVKRDNLNCLIVNLYRGNEGYSLAIKLGNGAETETVKFPYENEEFLSYLDNEQLPPMLLDIIDDAKVDLFHSGCIITEVRDYRRSIDTTYDSMYILLKPNNQSLAADIATMTRDRDWSSEERLLLEAEIVKRTAPPLNLNPSPIIAVIDNKIHQNKYKFSGVMTRKAAKRFSQVMINRQKKFEEGPPPKILRLHGFLSDRKDKRPLAKTIPEPKIPMVSDEEWPPLTYVSKNDDEVMAFRQKIFHDVRRFATALDKPTDLSDNSLVFVEEYTLETERGQGRIYLTKLTISQRRTDEIYFGELYVDRDYQEGKQNGSICRFQLGTLHQVQRYIKQFKEILTEEGRKAVTITHKVAGQPPRVLGNREKKEGVDQQSLTKQQILVQQQDQLKQGILGTFNMSTSPSVSIPLTSCISAAVVSSLAQSTPPPNVFLVSSNDGTIKKTTMSVGSKPNTVTSTSTLTNLLSQPTAGQQVVNLNSLLTGRQMVSNRVGSLTSIPTVTVSAGTLPQGAKITVNASTVGQKMSHPTLAAQLSRPVPSYSQAVSTAKLISLNQLNDAGIQIQSKPDSITSTVSGIGTSNLEALLTGSPAANLKTHSRNATLLERLTAKSVMINASKLQDASIMTHKIGGSIGSLSSPHQNINNISSSTASNILRSEGTGTGPPNINLANITNLPGLNVSLQSLASSLPGLQNVQVSFPGFTIPLSISVPSSSASSSTVLVTSPSPSNQIARTTVTTVVSSSPTTIMIASPSGLQQGQVVQLPIGQITSPQLAAQLTKASSQGSVGQSGIPVVQVQNIQGSLFTSVRGATTALSTGTSSVAGVQMAVPASEVTSTLLKSLSTSGGEITMGTLAHSSAAGSLGSSIVTLTSKQPITMTKQSTGKLQWHLQQKQVTTKRQQPK